MKLYVVIDDTNGVYGSRAFKTQIEAEGFAFNGIKNGGIESELMYITIQEIEVEEIMKISEFKDRLNQLEELHGDVEVMINTGETAHGWEIAEPYYSNRLGFVGVY